MFNEFENILTNLRASVLFDFGAVSTSLMRTVARLNSWGMSFRFAKLSQSFNNPSKPKKKYEYISVPVKGYKNV